MGGGKSQVGCTLGGCFAAAVVIIFCVAMTVSLLGGVGEATADTGTSACGETVDTLIPGTRMSPGDSEYKPLTEGKLGYEEHLDRTEPSHFCGKDSGNCSAMVHTYFVNPHTTDQEHWYINARWFGWVNEGYDFSHEKGAAAARKKILHAKVVVTLIEPGKKEKSLIASAEEYGPGTMLHTRDGIDFGAPPEVTKYLGGSGPYTKNPGDKHSLIKIAFAKDQDNAKLGPCE